MWNEKKKQTFKSRFNSRKSMSMSRSVGNSPVRECTIIQKGRDQEYSPDNRDSVSLYSRGSDASERFDDEKIRRVISSFHESEDNINVVVRVRPLNAKERKAKDAAVVQFPGNGQIMLNLPDLSNAGVLKPKLFSYNVVFEPAAIQEDVLQFSGMKRLLEMAVEGFRCTVFCYGQTGSGKTHTMTGPPGLFGKKIARYSDQHGLIFRAFLFLFQLLQEKPDVHFVLKASFLEIYNEKVIDLLNPGIKRKPLAVRWSKKSQGFFVENLFTVDCEEFDDLIAVLEEGLKNRAIGSHNMNEYSSRSHTILTVHITSEQPAEGGVFISRSGKINFVDLAGSEMTKKTQSAGKTLEEANNINKSLMVLGYCISSLSDSKRKNNHIPYRDSQLTKLLADSLAGNGVTLMIACISPARSNLSETLNTLRYAARAKVIKTKPVILMDPREALILSLKQTIEYLQNENEYLKSALDVQATSNKDFNTEKEMVSTPPKIDFENISKLEYPQLIELLKLYAAESETLKKENAELYFSREQVLRDQEVVCRENERLLKKLEDVNNACCRSPIITARPTLSADNLNQMGESERASDIWTNPIDSQNETLEMPESIQKELNRRRIGTSANANARRFSIAKEPDFTRQAKETDSIRQNAALPSIHTRNSLTRDLQQTRAGSKNREVFGSLVNLNGV